MRSPSVASVPSARDPRAAVRRLRSRYRRPLAAALAALATLIAISALRPAATPSAPDNVPAMQVGRPGDVTVPVPVAVGGGAVSTGDIVDLVAVDGTGTARIVAARVLVTEPASAAGYSSDTVVLLSMSESAALEVTTAADQAPLAVLIHPRSSGTT